ncbi:MAG TPA: DUF350 domain-containing protein [Tepidisphaeraceae bacterium]|nr:DUF350 domain-containing protein [Tepidisphaeraceae bacterium]
MTDLLAAFDRFDQSAVNVFLWSLIYGLLGIVLTVLGYKVFDWITPHIDVEKELADKQNVAVAIVCGALILGIAIVAAAALG